MKLVHLWSSLYCWKNVYVVGPPLQNYWGGGGGAAPSPIFLRLCFVVSCIHMLFWQDLQKKTIFVTPYLLSVKDPFRDLKHWYFKESSYMKEYISDASPIFLYTSASDISNYWYLKVNFLIPENLLWGIRRLKWT